MTMWLSTYDNRRLAWQVAAMRTLRPEDITSALLAQARSVRATDGTVATVLWESPARGTGEDLYVSVPELSDAHLAPLRERVAACADGG